MLAFLLIYNLFVGISSSCKPSVEGETYVFNYVFKHVLEEPLELVWLRNTIPISTCRRNMACYDYNAGRSVTTLRLLGDGIFEANHTLKNVTKSDAGGMYLKYLGLASLKNSQPLFNCTLLVYAFSALTLQECNDVVQEGSEVQCLCKKNDDISEHVELHWFNYKGEVQNIGNNLLSFVARKVEFGYTCRGWKFDGMESKPLEYKPIILNHNSEKNVNDVQESSFSIAVILISYCAILVLILSVLMMVFYCLTKGNVNSKVSFVKFKDLIKTKKRGDKLLYSMDYPDTFVNVEKKKSYYLLNTDLLYSSSFRSKVDTMSHYSIRQTKDFNIINESEDSEGYVSMDDSYR